MSEARVPVRTLLAGADALLLLADLLGPPGEHGERVRLPSTVEAGELARAVRPGDDRLCSALTELIEACAAAPGEAWSDEHHRLFEGAIVCPSNESAYIRRDKGVLLADICGFYRAFGFEPRERSGEKPDHVRCELEFAAMLLTMLASATHREASEQKDVTLGGLRAFAGDHAGEWIASFCDRLSGTSAIDVYPLLARALLIVWEVLSEDLGLPAPKGPELEPRAEPESWSTECGVIPGDGAPCAITVGGREARAADAGAIPQRPPA